MALKRGEGSHVRSQASPGASNNCLVTVLLELWVRCRQHPTGGMRGCGAGAAIPLTFGETCPPGRQHQLKAGDTLGRHERDFSGINPAKNLRAEGQRSPGRAWPQGVGLLENRGPWQTEEGAIAADASMTKSLLRGGQQQGTPPGMGLQMEGAAGRQLPHKFGGCGWPGKPPAAAGPQAALAGQTPRGKTRPRWGWSPGSPRQSCGEQPDSERDVRDPGTTLLPRTAESSLPFHHPQQFHLPTKHENFPPHFAEQRSFYLR